MFLPKDYVKNKKVLFSGRFDVPHLAHWVSVMRILHMGASKVVIVVLNYEGRTWPAQRAAQFFDEVVYLSDLQTIVEVRINNTHFAKITKKEFELYDCTRYIAGNNEVLHHIDSLGIRCVYMEPAYNIHASRYILEKE